MNRYASQQVGLNHGFDQHTRLRPDDCNPDSNLQVDFEQLNNYLE